MALGASFISLIPKKEGAISLKDLRAISLIGSIYKILDKALANRSRRVLPEVISDIKGAFVYGCQILDNVLIVNECIDSRYK